MTETQTVAGPEFGTCAPCGSNAADEGLFKFGHGGARHGAGRKARQVIPNSRNEVPRWYCVRTLFGKELLADIEIRLAGLVVFAPTLWKPATLARRCNGSIRPALPDRIEPLFRRYLFFSARCAADWQDVRHLPGVDCILGATPEAPTAMSDAVIAAIRNLPGMAMNGCVYPANVELRDGRPVVHVLPGSSARLVAGPLAELSGICQWSDSICQWSDSKRVNLLLELLGRVVAVTVPRSAVEVV